MKILKTLLFGLLLAVIVTFSLKNSEYEAVRYFNLIDPFEIPLFLLILISAFLGVFVGALVDLFKRYQLKKAIHGQKKMMDELLSEIRSVRNLAIAGSKDEMGNR